MRPSNALRISLMAFGAIIILDCGEDDNDESNGIEFSRERILNYVPYSPSAVDAMATSEGVVVEWVSKSAACVPETRTGVHHFVIYRREPNADAWEELAQAPPSQDCPETYEFVDRAASPGQTFVYGVTVVAEVFLDGVHQEAGESEVTMSAAVTIP